MSWRLRLSVETILRLTVLSSTVFSIAGLCAVHACLDDQALLAEREAIGSSVQTLGSVCAVVSSSSSWSGRVQRWVGFVEKTRTPAFARWQLISAWGRNRSDAPYERAGVQTDEGSQTWRAAEGQATAVPSTTSNL